MNVDNWLRPFVTAITNNCYYLLLEFQDTYVGYVGYYIWYVNLKWDRSAKNNTSVSSPYRLAHTGIIFGEPRTVTKYSYHKVKINS